MAMKALYIAIGLLFLTACTQISEPPELEIPTEEPPVFVSEIREDTIYYKGIVEKPNPCYNILKELDRAEDVIYLNLILETPEDGEACPTVIYEEEIEGTIELRGENTFRIYYENEKIYEEVVR